MGTIGQSMSSTVDKVSTMGSTAAKDKLMTSTPFGITTGHFHFGLGKTVDQPSNVNVVNNGVGTNVCHPHSPSVVRRNANLIGRTLGDAEANGYHSDHGSCPGTPCSGRKRSTPPKPPPKPAGLARLASLRSRQCRPQQTAINWSELCKDVRFLNRFFMYFSASERHILATVCSSWRNVLYQPKFWRSALPVVHFRQLRRQSTSIPADFRLRFYISLVRRGFDSVCLYGANEEDARDFVANCSRAAQDIHHLVLRCCSIADKGLETILDAMQGVYRLELAGCNEISEAGLWSSLNPRIVSLTVTDCINVADESLGAVSQLLPSLYEFNLQAYHVTDSALTYFSPKQSVSLNVLRLQSCWEISNQGIGNLVHALPNVTVLSLAGCSKITDAGVEIITENLKKLKCFDLSWCPRITDASLECIACDLTQLEELTLDRCVHVTDIGIGYISTMISLRALFLRWCSQIRDFGLQHLCSMRNLQVLSIAGCTQLSAGGISALIQLRHLRELELTNCPGSSPELYEYLRQNLFNCVVIE